MLPPPPLSPSLTSVPAASSASKPKWAKWTASLSAGSAADPLERGAGPLERGKSAAAADPLERGSGLELLWTMASMCEMSAVRSGRPCA